MRLKSILLSGVLCTLLSIAAPGAGAAPAEKSGGAAKGAEAKAKPVNAKCPVMPDDDADPKVTAVQDGKVVAFCCESCVDEFKKEPAKYMKVVAAEEKQKKGADKKDAKDSKQPAEGKQPAKGEQPAAGKAVNKFCPIDKESGVDPTVTTVYEGKTVGFCCEDCLKKFDTDPAAYAAKMK